MYTRLTFSPTQLPSRYFINLQEKTTTWEDPRAKLRNVYGNAIPMQVSSKSLIVAFDVIKREPHRSRRCMAPQKSHKFRFIQHSHTRPKHFKATPAAP